MVTKGNTKFYRKHPFFYTFMPVIRWNFGKKYIHLQKICTERKILISKSVCIKEAEIICKDKKN